MFLNRNNSNLNLQVLENVVNEDLLLNQVQFLIFKMEFIQCGGRHFDLLMHVLFIKKPYSDILIAATKKLYYFL